MFPENLVFTENAANALNGILGSMQYSQMACLVDENTRKFCLDRIKDSLQGNELIIEIESGESQKHLDTCKSIWSRLTESEFDRQGLLINLGGGVICDMGGFCAATYKRGIKFINIPTSLLAMVDAGFGGKVGIDFHDIKNQVGLFSEPENVIVDPAFLETLPDDQLKSGFAEIIKHSLIADAGYFDEIVKYNLNDQPWDQHIVNSIKIKNGVVMQDPYETGFRKILNFGHTVGHAVESYFLGTNNNLLHGEAVALGMICEIYLSEKVLKLESEKAERACSYIRSIFGTLKISENAINEIVNIIKQDKKSNEEKIQAVLLNDIAIPEIDCEVSNEDIKESLLYYLNLDKDIV